MVRKGANKIPGSAVARDRYFGVLLEEINGKLSLLLEGYAGLDSRMSKLEDRMETLEKRMDQLEVRMDSLEQRFEAFCIETNQKFAALFEGQQELFEEMRQFHLRLTALEGKS